MPKQLKREIFTCRMRQEYRGLRPAQDYPLPLLHEYLWVVDDGGKRQEVKVTAVNEREGTFDAKAVE
jgi:hypothetical protein